MQNFDSDREMGDNAADRAADVVALRGAAEELHAAIDRLTGAMLDASPIDKAEARDQFDIALRDYASHLDVSSV